jgi:predicted ATPase/DNA-binding winged helix-turn-helix (wHTH) protein
MTMHYIFGDYILDTQRYDLHQAGVLIPLPPKVFQVLTYLLAHGDRVVSKEELLEHLWPGQYVGDEALSSYIMAVRKALGDDGHRQRLLRTVRRRGYRFVAPVEVREPVPLADSPRTGHLLGIEATAHEPPPPPPPAVADPASLTAPRADSEYKPVSVLCCALADTPTLAARLGPEGLYRMLQTVLGLAQEVVQHYTGSLTPYGSEGFTAAFGAPVAQEDHARRAVLAALELSQHPALRTLTPGGGMAVQMGVHSGLVVVGGLGQDLQPHATVVGAPVALALRLQQRATPGTILLSAATYQLVHAEVEATPCGTLDMDGSGTPVPVYTVHGLLRRHAGVAGRGPRAASPFVGREWELALLHDRLAAACVGQGQVVGLVGEPGMGKTRLVTEFCRGLAGQPVTVYVGQCLSYGQITPYLPVRDLLRQLCGLVEGDEAAVHTAAVQQRLHAGGISAEEDVALVCQLLDLPVAPECLERLSPEARQARTFALLRHLIFDTVQQQPLVLVVENLHWSDATSVVWLASLVERLAGVAVLVLGTYRPGYQPAWGTHSAAMQVALAPLRAQDSRTVAQAVLGTVHLPEVRLQEMVARAGGNPFFLEELAWHAVEHARPDTPGAVPETVHAVLASRMDRLPPESKRLLQTAAVIGTEVPFSLLQAITEQSEEVLQRSLTHLQAAEFLYETRLVPELTYTFKHALIQEVAYESLLTTHRQALHAAVGQALETLYAPRLEDAYDRLAYHYARTNDVTKAVAYLILVAKKAAHNSAHVEAIAHLTHGLELLKMLPATPERSQQELALYITLGASLIATKGYAAPEVGETYTRARQLCQSLDDPHQLFPVLRGLWNYYNVRADFRTAHELGEQLLALAQQVQDAAMLCAAHRALGTTLFNLGAVASALTHYAQGMALYDPQQHRASAFLYGDNAGVVCHIFAAWALWYLGYPDQGQVQNDAAVTLAQQSDHPFSLGYALSAAAIFHAYRREGRAAQAHAEAAIVLAMEQEFPIWTARGSILHGWALAQQGQAREGIEQLRHGLIALRATGAEAMRPYFLALLAEAYGTLNQPEAGLAALAEALTVSGTTGERWEEPEVYRLKGALLLQQSADNHAAAQACFQHALAVARSLQAKSLELRAATSLVRLWQHQGKHAAARELLRPIYGWFTEGFDTTDLQEAKALLDDLA